MKDLILTSLMTERELYLEGWRRIAGQPLTDVLVRIGWVRPTDGIMEPGQIAQALDKVTYGPDHGPLLIAVQDFLAEASWGRGGVHVEWLDPLEHSTAETLARWDASNHHWSAQKLNELAAPLAHASHVLRPEYRTGSWPISGDDLARFNYAKGL